MKVSFKFIFVICLCLIFSFFAKAQDLLKHNVQLNEVLSGIVQKYFPGSKLYAKDGKIQEILNYNPHIKNMNYIYPNQVILFSDSKEMKAEESDSQLSENNSVEIPEKSVDPTAEKRFPIKIWALTGLKFVSLDQQGALGTGNINSAFLNYYNLGFSVAFDEWLTSFKYETYKAYYKISGSNKSESFNNFGIAIAHGWYSFAIGSEQAPILSARVLPVLNKQSLLYAGLGLQKEYGFSAWQKSSFVDLKFQARYPLKSFAETSGIMVDSLSGYHFVGQVDARMPILSKEKYQLFINWFNSIEYQNLSYDINWNSSLGKVKSQSFNGATALGLSADF